MTSPLQTLHFCPVWFTAGARGMARGKGAKAGALELGPWVAQGDEDQATDDGIFLASHELPFAKAKQLTS